MPTNEICWQLGPGGEKVGTFAEPELAEAQLESADYRGILAVLGVVQQARSTGEFQRLALEAIEEHLGYRRTTFFFGEPPVPGFKRFAGWTRGLKMVHLEEYLDRWTGDDPFVSGAATNRMRTQHVVELRELAADVHPNERRYVEAFLLRQGSSQVSLWLDTGLPRHGYLSVFGKRATEFTSRDRAILLALRPHLAYVLRAILLDGAPAPSRSGLSPREAEVGSMVALGCSNREIARHLGIGEDTVKKHLLHAMAKLHVRNRTQLAIVLRNGAPRQYTLETDR